MSHTADELGEDFDANYDVFLADAIATGCVWGLESAEGWALCPSVSNEEIEVMPFWSQPEYAQVHCKEEWSTYKPVPISLEELLDEWLPGMHEDVIMVGVNWTRNMDGIEIEPLDLAEDFEQVE